MGVYIVKKQEVGSIVHLLLVEQFEESLIDPVGIGQSIGQSFVVVEITGESESTFHPQVGYQPQGAIPGSGESLGQGSNSRAQLCPGSMDSVHFRVKARQHGHV